MPGICAPHIQRQDSAERSRFADAPNFIKGVAIIWVVVFHLYKDFPDYFCPGDRAGLSLFHLALLGALAVNLFVISSGLLLMKAYQRRGHPKIWWKTFLLKRFLRIFPLYYACLAAVFALDYLIGPNNFHIEIPSLLAHLLGVHTLTPFMFDIEGAWWFIGLIVQLYLCFPMLCFAFGTSRNKMTDLLILTLLLALAVAARFFPYLNLNSNYSLPAFLPDFCAGMIIAKYLPADLRMGKSFVSVCIALGSSALLLYTLALNIPVFDHSYGLFRSIVALGIFFLALFVFEILARLNRTIPQFLCLFGIYSYPIYLCHRPIIYKYVKMFSCHLPPPVVVLLFLLLLLPVAVALQKMEALVVGRLTAGDSARRLIAGQSHS